MPQRGCSCKYGTLRTTSVDDTLQCMKRGVHHDVESSAQQRVVQRNRKYVMLPASALALALLLVSWQLIRENLPENSVQRWPWRLQLLDLQSSVTLFTVLVVLLFTRMQYAETLRPALGWSITPRGGLTAIGHPGQEQGQWQVRMFNGGGGMAILSSIEYRIEFASDRPQNRWLTFDAAEDLIRRSSLKERIDYVLDRKGAGYPMPASGETEKDLLILSISPSAMAMFRVFDIKVRVVDAVGDTHERTCRCREMFPLVDPPQINGEIDESTAQPGVDNENAAGA
jgi:hypothetical protein